MSRQQSFKRVVREIAKSLVSCGFLRQGNTLAYKEGDNLGLISFHKSQQTASEAVTFTVDVGVVSGLLAEFFSLRIFDRPPPAGQWHWRQRLGFLLPAGRDRWWTVTSPSSADEAIVQIREMISTYAIPQMKRYLRDERLMELWLGGESPGLTRVQRLKNLVVLVRTLGPPDRFRAILQELYATSRSNAIILERQLDDAK